MKQSAIKFNAQPADVHMPTYNYLAMVDPTYTFTPFGERESHSLTPLEFNKDGVVISSNMVERPLKGQLATVGRLILLVLSEGDSKSDRQYPVSDWFHGFGDSSVDWAPTFCSTDEMPSPWSATDEFYKYGPKFKATDPVKPIFGCREWGYQLYDDMRPYIDVTSYAPKTKSHPHGTYIRPFVGWARFGDRKPVIGKDADTWYCLYDCPAGDQPGPIPDIAQWATRSGWPVPQRPTRAPTFPDAPGKQGRYVTSAPAQATGTR
ncbi:MAG TPA: hypothetical protein VJ673_09500 [Aromatoleum sp.]|uniref:hypothetical protein n=1 Tax=Aromatoleum sp. TaxID=2307007 RepID=UPI002B49AEBD|nr:hypothetical protein [Aromatoleum sp.]HJV25913.1 hypothetical protein [Aromatoleum sp.]